jgi:hypothetical protein
LLPGLSARLVIARSDNFILILSANSESTTSRSTTAGRRPRQPDGQGPSWTSPSRLSRRQVRRRLLRALAARPTTSLSRTSTRSSAFARRRSTEPRALESTARIVAHSRTPSVAAHSASRPDSHSAQAGRSEWLSTHAASSFAHRNAQSDSTGHRPPDPPLSARFRGRTLRRSDSDAPSGALTPGADSTEMGAEKGGPGP